MITFPDPAGYSFTPWTDPNGIQWIYNSVKTRWARYRVAGGGTALTSYVSQVASLSDYPAILETPQAAATASIRKIGTGATDSAAGNHTHPPQTEITIEQFGALSFTGGVSGVLNIFADNVDGNHDVQLPNKGGTIAFTSDLGGQSNALVFGTGDEVVSMSLISTVATFTFGTNAKAALRDALDVPASDPTGITGADAITNMVSLTAAEYAAITPNSTTLYVVT
jgi:hypothetical protein